MSYPSDRRYTNDHEWARQDGTLVSIGITHYAQDSLGDIVYLELPQVGAELEKGQAFGVVESTKAVSDLFAPMAGKVVEVNSALVDGPETVNTDAHGSWFIKIEPANAAEFDALLTSEQYERLLADAG